MAGTRSATAKERRHSARNERRKDRKKERRTQASKLATPAKESKSPKSAPLRSLLGEADDMPLCTLNCPRPKTAPKTAPKGAPKTTEKITERPKKKKKRQKTKKLAHSFDPLEKNVRSYHPMPKDYIFVPKGDVYITRHCRSKTRTIKEMVYIVWDRTGSKKLGIRVPSSVHFEVLEMSSETAQYRALLVQANNTKILTHGHSLLLQEYPKIPADSLETIVKHAFLKGSGRVGRSNVLPDRRKALLAVQAYIRHNLTSYEHLLRRNKKRGEARKEVEPLVKAIMKSWMGVSGEQNENLAIPGTSLDDAISISSSPCSSRAGSVISVESGGSEGSGGSEDSEDSAESLEIL